MIFPYGARETEYLSRRDPALGAWIDRIGHVSRACIPDLFAALVNAIAAQQVSTRAYETVWARILARGLDRPENALEGSMDGIGLGPRKEKWIRSIAQRALDGTLEKEAFSDLDDEAAISRLMELPGVGRWTAQMLLIFCLNRMDVLSPGDFGVRRGLTMLHGEGALRAFDHWRQTYSPCGSVASIYLWEIAGGKHIEI